MWKQNAVGQLGGLQWGEARLEGTARQLLLPQTAPKKKECLWGGVCQIGVAEGDSGGLLTNAYSTASS